MKTYLIFTMTALLTATSCSVKKEDTKSFSGVPGEVKLITLDPGHFHAALVQKILTRRLPMKYMYMLRSVMM